MLQVLTLLLRHRSHCRQAVAPTLLTVHPYPACAAENSHPSYSVAGRGTELDISLQLLPSYLRMRTSAPHVWRATTQVSLKFTVHHQACTPLQLCAAHLSHHYTLCIPHAGMGCCVQCRVHVRVLCAIPIFRLMRCSDAENPKIWTACGHHFHLACIYEWLERKQTCPLCDTPMGFEEIL